MNIFKLIARHARFAYYLSRCDVHLMKRFGFDRRMSMQFVTEWKPLLWLAFHDGLEPEHAIELMLEHEIDMAVDRAFAKLDDAVVLEHGLIPGQDF